MLREQAAAIGIALDVVPLESRAMIARMLACDYDAIYMRPLATDLDPAGNLDFWLSSGVGASLEHAAEDAGHRMGAADRHADARAGGGPRSAQRRRSCSTRCRQLLAENLPVLYFAAPRMYTAHSAACAVVVPSILRPPVLWNADYARACPRTTSPADGALLVRRLVFALVLVAVTSSAALLLARLTPGDLTSQLGIFAPAREAWRTRAHASISIEPGLAVEAVGRRAPPGSTSATPSLYNQPVGAAGGAGGREHPHLGDGGAR